MKLKYFQLTLTAVWIGNIITIHASDQFISTVLDTFVQCISKTTVFRQSDNVQYVSHFLLLLGNHFVQCFIQWAIAD